MEVENLALNSFYVTGKCKTKANCKPIWLDGLNLKRIGTNSTQMSVYAQTLVLSLI